MESLNPYVAKISIYPIKSLDGVDVKTASIASGGALVGDRELALFDSQGNFVNGKRYDRIHTIRVLYESVDDNINTILVRAPGLLKEARFDLVNDRTSLAQYLSQYFEFTVEIRQNKIMGFPDDTDSPGPTIVSTATLETIASWYPTLDVAEIRRRFRANIEIAGVPAFWEDRLFAKAGTPGKFQIGSVTCLGINPCQRCIVVTRDSQSGLADRQFQKTFISRREETLPSWVERSRFNHFYRLSVNTQIPSTEAGKAIRVGDRLRES
jgi:uncharacterized protein